MHLTPVDVAPMMRGSTFLSARRALACLWRMDVLREFAAGARGVVRGRAGSAQEVEAMVSDSLQRAEDHIERNLGIAKPDGFESRAEVCAFVRRFGRSRAQDMLATLDRRTRPLRAPPRLDEDAPDAGTDMDRLPAPMPEPSVDEPLLAAVRTVVEVNLAPARALVLGLLYVPDVVDLAWLELHRARLSRSPDETLALWRTWWRAHDVVTMTREQERLEHLAWILRTRLDGDWRAWVAASPEHVRACVNTLQRGRARGLQDARDFLA